MVTSFLYQPFVAGIAEETDALIAGGDAACTFKATFADALFPALSVAVPLNTWFGPTVVTETLFNELATPESVSVQAKFIVTAPPAGRITVPLTAGGMTVAVIVGGVLSMDTLIVTVAVFPALSTAGALTRLCLSSLSALCVCRGTATA